jgi:hypothetical protein
VPLSPAPATVTTVPPLSINRDIIVHRVSIENRASPALLKVQIRGVSVRPRCHTLRRNVNRAHAPARANCTVPCTAMTVMPVHAFRTACVGWRSAGIPGRYKRGEAERGHGAVLV